VRIILSFVAVFFAAPLALAQQIPNQPVTLTIYNQGFAIARTSIDLDLHSGANEVTTTGVTSMLEPDSVVLRDPAGKRAFHVVEQNYERRRCEPGMAAMSGCPCGPPARIILCLWRRDEQGHAQIRIGCVRRHSGHSESLR
jgi:hypothetical protein